MDEKPTTRWCGHGIAMLAALFMGAAVCGQTTRPIAKAAATRPSPDELHAQAIALMRKGQFPKARVLLDQACSATPAAQRARPLVLNRAILDLNSKSVTARTLRELNEYLTKHRAADELATNILGAVLNIAADDPRVKQSQAWRDALREWERRNYQLDHARPGYHRWGADWIDEEAYLELQAAQKDSETAIKEQEERLERASWRAGAARLEHEQFEHARRRSQTLYFDDNYLPLEQRKLGRERANRPNAQLTTQPAVERRFQELEWRENRTIRTPGSRAKQVYDFSLREEETERRKLEMLRRNVPRPTWPTRFVPVAITELEPPSLPPGDPKAVAAAANDPTKDAAGLEGWGGAFGQPAPLASPTTAPALRNEKATIPEELPRDPAWPTPPPGAPTTRSGRP